MNFPAGRKRRSASEVHFSWQMGQKKKVAKATKMRKG